jgi:hypothetical protein
VLGDDRAIAAIYLRGRRIELRQQRAAH